MAQLTSAAVTVNHLIPFELNNNVNAAYVSYAPDVKCYIVLQHIEPPLSSDQNGKYYRITEF